MCSGHQGASRLVGDSSKINSSHKLSALGVANVAAVLLIILALLMIFAGWPIIVHVQEITVGNSGAFGMAGTNASGQVPRLDTNSAMIDDDTPTSAKTKKGSKGDDFTLIFSDEFNTDGRTFYEGEDRACPTTIRGRSPSRNQTDAEVWPLCSLLGGYGPLLSVLLCSCCLKQNER